MRTILALALCLAVAAVEPVEIRLTRLSDRLLVLHCGPWDDQMVVVDAGPSLVVIDTWASPQAAQRGRQLAETTFGKKVHHVLNTHHHWDHTFGNQAFKDCVIVGQAEVPSTMIQDYGTRAGLLKTFQDLEDPKGDPAVQAHLKAVAQEALRDLRLSPPTRLVSRAEDLRIGTLTFRLLPTPGFHTRTYLVVHVLEVGLLVAQRDLGMGRPPKPEPGADLTPILATLARVRSEPRPLRWGLVGHFQPIEHPDLEATLRAWKALASTGPGQGPGGGR